MSDLNNTGKENDEYTAGQNLTVDELAAAMCREISGEEEPEEEMAAEETPEEETVAEDTSEEKSEAITEAAPEEEAEEVEEASEEEPEEETVAEEASEEEAEEETVVEEASEEEPEEETVAEEASEEEPEKDTVTEEIPAEETVEEEQKEEIPEEDSVEDAFDKEDTGVLDVSQGIRSMADAPTEELPYIPQSTAAPQAEAQKTEEVPEQIVDKKLLKQEAKEARLREKQEEKERRKQEKAEKKANKKKGPFKIILMVLLLLIVAAAVVYLALSNRYKTVFFDGTKINGTDCTGLTVEEAETVVARQLDAYQLTLNFRDGKQEVISGDSIGFAYVPDGSVQDIKDSQIPILWVSAFFDDYSYEATAACSFDAQKLTDTITALEECNMVNMVAPQNAYVNFNEETKSFEIVPEVNGNTFDLSSLLEAAQTAVSTGVREINVEDLGIYQNPDITSDNAELITQRDEMNDAVSSSITYTLPTGETQVLDASTLATWLSRDEQGNYYVDPELWGNHVAWYVEDLAQKVNTSDAKADFKTHNGTTVSLDNYLQGWLVDQEAEGQQLTQELSDRTVTTREPIYAQRAYATDNNGIGTTYVEVDLTAQHLYAYDNGSLILDCDIVSGKMTTDRYTPEGIYPLAGKQAGRWLRGDMQADGSYEYESWVDYWMPFNGGIGLHDASWRVEFGGSIYQGGGSHGCVNMPSSMAAQLFDWITTGTPVITYYTAAYTLSPATDDD